MSSQIAPCRCGSTTKLIAMGTARTPVCVTCAQGAMSDTFARIRASSDKRGRRSATALKGRIVQAILGIPVKDRDMRAVVETVLGVVRAVK